MKALRLPVVAGLAIALIVLLLHIRLYAFQCDDAFISYRYARNLAHGFGLVFNPGFERVEGYSNFLWVLLLAAFDRLGAVPERVAPWLSIAATLALWGLVVKRAARDARPAWTVLVAPTLLALNRSFAVWSTSGLETRAFELFVVAGVLRLDDEMAGARDGKPRVPLAATLFALAALTRPDGALVALCAFGCAALFTLRRGLPALMRLTVGWLPFVILVGGHYLWRHAYYGDWFPNTYYAKVGGRTWWDAGFQYLAAFALEYGALLWIPFVAAGVGALRRAGRGFEPALIGAVLIPHALYVAAVGGDHFEYRPLDLALPLVFLLIGRGAGALLDGPGAAGAPARRGLGAPVVAAALVLVAWASVELPWQSHRQYPTRYLPGFPGLPNVESERFLDPSHDTLFRMPLFSWAAGVHQRLLRNLTSRFVGIRAEEHAHFLAKSTAEGKRLRGLVDAGVLPRDTHVAFPCVGAIPYYSDLRTLDRLGLTDRVVAHSQPTQERVMAHDRAATIEYARAQGVDLWAANDVYLLAPTTSDKPINLKLRGVEYWTAEVSAHEIMIALLPMGTEQAARRFPRLRFVNGLSDSFMIAYLERGIAQLRDSLERVPNDVLASRDLAIFLLARGDFAGAYAAYVPVLEARPNDDRALLDAALCLHMLQRDSEARPLVERLLAIGTMRSDYGLVHRARGLLDQF